MALALEVLAVEVDRLVDRLEEAEEGLRESLVCREVRSSRSSELETYACVALC